MRWISAEGCGEIELKYVLQVSSLEGRVYHEKYRPCERPESMLQQANIQQLNPFDTISSSAITSRLAWKNSNQ